MSLPPASARVLMVKARVSVVPAAPTADTLRLATTMSPWVPSLAVWKLLRETMPAVLSIVVERVDGSLKGNAPGLTAVTLTTAGLKLMVKSKAASPVPGVPAVPGMPLTVTGMVAVAPGPMLAEPTSTLVACCAICTWPWTVVTGMGKRTGGWIVISAPTRSTAGITAGSGNHELSK